MLYDWYAGSGRNLHLSLTEEQIELMSHAGECKYDVENCLPDLKKQTILWGIKELAAELKEYGAWDDDELADHEANIERMVWIAAGDLREELRAMDEV